MSGPAHSWSTQQLVEFLAVVAACADTRSAAQAAVERAAEALEADVAAVVAGEQVVAVTGFPADDVPVAALVEAAARRSATFALPWGETCECLSVSLGDDGGLLLLGRIGAGPFAAEESSLARGMARVLALSLRSIGLLDESEARAAENAALAASLEERRRLLERLARIQRSIVQRAELQQVLDAIIGGARELLGDDVAVLRLVDADDPTALVLAASSGIDAELAARIRRSSTSDGATGRAVTTGEVVVVDDYAGFGAALDALGPLELRAAIAAPVHENGRVIGSLVVSSRRPGRSYSAGEQDVLVAFAEHASLALTDARNFADAMHRAHYDGLTGLPNRTVLLDRLRETLGRRSAGGGHSAVLFLDLDHFKAVNDTLGHPVGDELLRLVARRLERCTRSGDTVARFGGDEFAVLLDDASGDHGERLVAERILDSLQQPFALAGQQVRIGASIGIVAAAGDADDLLRNADLAMYQAKGEGRSRYEVFRPAMRTAVLEHVELTGALRVAAERGELRAHYQPIVALGGARPVGFEALLRWEHPTRGLLAPAAFIPIAEESRQILALGRWVLFEACRQAVAWRDVAPSIAVNLSAHQLHDDALSYDVARALEESGLAPEALTLEITETVLMADTSETLRRLRELKTLGVRIAIDDFGTGYSSLQYLAQFPIDALKIPKPFVDRVALDGDERTLARAIIFLARNFRLDVVGEGIETPEQHAALADLGCRLGQGYLFSRPLEPAAAAAWLAARPAAVDGDAAGDVRAAA